MYEISSYSHKVNSNSIILSFHGKVTYIYNTKSFVLLIDVAEKRIIGINNKLILV